MHAGEKQEKQLKVWNLFPKTGTLTLGEGYDILTLQIK